MICFINAYVSKCYFVILFLFKSEIYLRMTRVLKSKKLISIFFTSKRIWCQDTVDIKLLHKFETPLTRSFLTFLNSHYPNIKFTLEKEKDNETAFLDILIKPIIVFPQVCFGKVRQLVYIPIFTPFSYKIGLIKILIHWTYLISSS